MSDLIEKVARAIDEDWWTTSNEQAARAAIAVVLAEFHKYAMGFGGRSGWSLVEDYAKENGVEI